MRKVVVFSFDEAHEAYLQVAEPFEMFCIDQDSMQVMQSKTLSDAKEFYGLKNSCRALKAALDKCEETLKKVGPIYPPDFGIAPWIHGAGMVDPTGKFCIIDTEGKWKKPNISKDESHYSDALHYLSESLRQAMIPTSDPDCKIMGLDAQIRAGQDDDMEVDEDDLDLQMDGDEDDSDLGIGDSDWDKEDGTATKPDEADKDYELALRRKEGRCPQCGELGAFIKLQPTCSKHGPY